ncbi:MAG TPA: hypothetical protein ENN87_13485, partial [Phycisphaerales bacterium]|nr:hypothetical protein [Phycisphaerales bacterium]
MPCTGPLGRAGRTPSGRRHCRAPAVRKQGKEHARARPADGGQIMKSLLYIQASPRRDRSRSITVADRFVQACRDRQKGLEVIRLNLFEADLPVFDGAALEAKYAILHGQDVRPEHKAAWAEVEAVIEAFRRADAYVFAVPMWNFGLPYRLKHYFDVLIQPGYTFTFDPDAGYSGLVTGKPAMVVYARGGAYPADTPMAAYDL